MADVEKASDADSGLTECGKSESINGHSSDTLKGKGQKQEKDLENGDAAEALKKDSHPPQVNGELSDKPQADKADPKMDARQPEKKEEPSSRSNCDSQEARSPLGCSKNGGGSDGDAQPKGDDPDEKGKSPPTQTGDQKDPAVPGDSKEDANATEPAKSVAENDAKSASGSDDASGAKEEGSDVKEKGGAEEPADAKERVEPKDDDSKERRKKDDTSADSSVAKDDKDGKNSAPASDDDVEILPKGGEKKGASTPKTSSKGQDEDDESDIEMIEESDPLAISDADVKKAKEENKNKKESNVIIIDTNTLIKNQGNLTASVGSLSRTRSQTAKAAAAAVPSTTAHSPHTSPVAVTATAAGTTSNTTSVATSSVNASTNSATIQTAIQAITGGSPAIQGLQTAYLSAIQQALLAQGSGQLSNPHYLTQLQQYYNTLTALQDDAYVIEAPSFIVPYVMEGKPKESIKDFLLRINKELEEFEKKQAEEKKKKEEEKRKQEEEEKKKLEEEEKKKKEEEEGEGEEKSTEDCKKKETDEKMEVDEDDKEEGKTKKKENKKGESPEGEKEEKVSGDNKETKEKETKSEADKKKIEKAKDGSKEESETKTKTDTSSSSKDDNKENKEKDDKDEVTIEKEVPKTDFSHLGRWESYYHSALGKFFLELGLSHAQEFIQSDLLRMQKRRLEKLKSNPTKQDMVAVKSLEIQLNRTKEKNAHLRTELRTCKFCSFKTESKLVMDRHLESPHMVNYTYKCNFCEFETRGPQVILFHMEAEHNVRGRLERAPAFFQCPLCPYEDNNKSKMTRHSFSCSKKFRPEKNLDMSDWEPPAKIPKIHRGRPHHPLTKPFDQLSKMPNILPKGLGNITLNLQNAISSGLITTALQSNAATNSLAGRGRGRPIGSYKNITQTLGSRNNSSILYQNRPGTTSFLHSIPGVSTAQQLSIASQMLQSVQNRSGTNKSPQQPSISITPLPRTGTQSTSGKSTISTSNLRDGSGSRPPFVICEVCDGYIKDLEQLRNHMNLIHKVKIHPKMIYNRPPLNCQKCQQRFFTDQGLERHLLGTHGLVTSSMQEAANKGKDAGRCPICGKVFQWKLLNHVNRDHKMTLKPAHLSYKCTVCTATFNMYRLFENHVYSAHSVVKNKEQGSTSSSTTSTSASASSSTKKTTSEAPLKINDEITIIPQPASKSLKSDSKTASASSKKSETPSVSKEITITKVGSRSSRRSGANSGGGVEVISLDDSPSKRQAEDAPNPKKRGRETSTSKRARTST